MSEDPLVSAIIPTYNRPDRLKRAVSSIQNQTYENIEIIIVDDASETKVENIVRKNAEGKRTKYIRHIQNRGANVARNTGISEASGTLIAFLDDDDVWHKTKIEKQVECYQNSQAGFVYTGSRHISDGGNVYRSSMPGKNTEIKKKLLQRNIVGTFSVALVEKDVIQEAGFPDPDLPIWQDREWYIRLSNYTQFAAVDEILVDHYVGGDERISDNFEGLVNITLPILLQRYRDDIQSLGILQKKVVLSNIFYTVARYGLSTGEYSKSRRYSMYSVKYNPLNWKSYVVIIMSLFNGALYTTYKNIISAISAGSGR